MPIHSQEADKALIEKKTSKLMKKSDYLRIKLLFAKWKNWLFYLTFGYLVVFLVWKEINRKALGFFHLIDLSIRKYHSDFVLNWIWRFPILTVLITMRGLVFCADGIVSSWLKSPFGQITYSINKSGIETSKSDEIVTLLTEVNEHFKETFKKFGVFTISLDLVEIFHSVIIPSTSSFKAEEYSLSVRNVVSVFLRGRFLEQTKNIESFMTFAIVIPIFLATWRMQGAQKIIENLEFKDD